MRLLRGGGGAFDNVGVDLWTWPAPSFRAISWSGAWGGEEERGASVMWRSGRTTRVPSPLFPSFPFPPTSHQTWANSLLLPLHAYMNTSVFKHNTWLRPHNTWQKDVDASLQQIFVNVKYLWNKCEMAVLFCWKLEHFLAYNNDVILKEQSKAVSQYPWASCLDSKSQGFLVIGLQCLGTYNGHKMPETANTKHRIMNIKYWNNPNLNFPFRFF